MWLGAVECLMHWGLYSPNSVALVIGRTARSYGQIAAGAAELAESVKQAGLADQRVGIICSKKLQLLCGFYAAQLAGSSTVLYHPTWNPQALATAVSDTHPRGFIVDERGAELLASVPDTKHVIQCITLDPKRHTRPASIDTLPRRTQDDEWGIVFSSGSTGRPKPIVHTHYSIMSECLAWCIELGLTKDHTFYVTRPLYYTGGLVLALATLMTRGKLVADDYTDDNNEIEIKAKLQQAAEHTVIDHCFFVPEVARAILAADAVWTCQGNPRQILLMGSKVHAVEKQNLGKLFGCSIIESWGNSEGLGTITEPEDLENRPTSIGRPFLTERLWIMNDALEELAPGQAGHIVGSDETMFKEYANQPEATSRAKRRAFVVSDDIGFRDDSGFFYILGREEDVITYGERVLCAPGIERSILGVPGVREVYVNLKRSPTGVDVNVLLASDSGSFDDDRRTALYELIQGSAPNIALNVLVRVVDTLPKLSSGKVDRLRTRSIVVSD
jgi:fatty-acyl-CoA synthase